MGDSNLELLKGKNLIHQNRKGIAIEMMFSSSADKKNKKDLTDINQMNPGQSTTTF